jgi:hypothetical protein
MISRRGFVIRAAGFALASVGARRLLAQTATAPGTPITVYKSASCGCCAKWVDNLSQNGFTPAVHDEDDMDTVKDEMGVPKELRSCHTALLGRYLVEGHVPAADLRRLLAEQPAVVGLAAPGMPASSPGMAVAGAPHEAYDVLAFGRDGKTTVFAKH